MEQIYRSRVVIMYLWMQVLLIASLGWIHSQMCNFQNVPDIICTIVLAIRAKIVMDCPDNSYSTERERVYYVGKKLASVATIQIVSLLFRKLGLCCMPNRLKWIVTQSSFKTVSRWYAWRDLCHSKWTLQLMLANIVSKPFECAQLQL